MTPAWQRLRRWAGRRLRGTPAPAPATAGTQAPAVPIDIPETTPLRGHAVPDGRPRLNLLLPAVQPEHVFGGISTALQFFDTLIEDDVDARIVLTDQSAPSAGLPTLLQGWRFADPDAPDQPGRLIVPFGDRSRRTLPVRGQDVFVATAWWTAYVLRHLLAWQTQAHGGPRRPMVYLVQDHEPGFYPLSTRSLMARSTYQYDGPMLGVFNTGLLRDYFAQQPGYTFTRRDAFEPQLNPVLARARAQSRVLRKERHLILYGRPGVARNAFEMVCQGVRHWSALDPQAADWRIESLGEPHADIALHHGARIVSRGKLSLDEYVRTLQTASLGVSLMLSPHPSYPPLEMAEFGVHTITNHYENKDLGTRSPLLHSLSAVTPEAIGERLQALAQAFGAQPGREVALAAGSLFSPAGSAFPFAAELRGLVLPRP